MTVLINNYFSFFSTVKPTVIDVDIFVNSIGPVSSINMVSQSFFFQFSLHFAYIQHSFCPHVGAKSHWYFFLTLKCVQPIVWYRDGEESLNFMELHAAQTVLGRMLLLCPGEKRLPSNKSVSSTASLPVSSV